MLVYSDLRAKFDKPYIAKGAFGCVLIFMLLDMGYRLFFSHNELLIQDNQRLPRHSNTEIAAQMNQSLGEPLFGNYLPKNLNPAEVKQSMLNITVVGIMYSPHDNSLAILKMGSDRENTYHTGDQLPGHVVIKKITKEGVFVDHNGILESLSLPKQQLMFDKPAKPLHQLGD